MKRLILASLSTLVLFAVAAPQAHALAAPSSDNFVQQVLRHNEDLQLEQTQVAQPNAELKVSQPMIKSYQMNSVTQNRKASSTEMPSFEYFEYQYFEHYGS
jgi:hypothetical protein